MKKILIELKAKTESEVSVLIEEMNKSKLLEIDFDYKPVPIKRRKRKLEMADDTFVIRGKALEDDIKKLATLPFIVKIWNDTEIDHFLCKCNSSKKGTLDDVAECIGAKQLWEKGYKGEGIIIGIVDGGVDKNLISNVIGGCNTDWGTNIQWGGHGNMTSTDALGIAPNAKIYDLRIAPGTTQANISNAIAAYNWALQLNANERPHILSNSWGIYQEAWDTDYATSPNHPFTLKVEEAIDAGIKVLFAAGNCGETCPDTRCKNDTGGGRDIWGANGHEEVITVAAVKLNNNRLKYSSQGPAALSDRKPDFCGYSSFKGYYWDINGNPDSGTSAACPVLAGAVALLLNYNSNLTQLQIKDLLQNTAKDIEDYGFDYNTGYGVVRLDNAYYELEPSQKPKEDFRDKLCDYVYNTERHCVKWADEGSYQCSQWADEGSNQCSQWADEGSNQCASSYYNNCHWYSPWNCVAGWFCQAYYWVSNWVCQAYYWVANWVCKAWYWIAKWVCKAWYWVAKWICKAWYWVAKWVCKLYILIITSVTFTNCKCR